MAKFREVFSAPKPKKDGSGATIQFQLSTSSGPKKGCVFMTMAKQNSNTSVDNATFDYKNSIKFKLSTQELGSFIRVFNGSDNSINGDKGLFHKFENKTSTIKCNKNDPKYGDGFFINGSKGEDKCGVKITTAEAQVLICLFTQAIVNIYHWEPNVGFDT